MQRSLFDRHNPIANSEVAAHRNKLRAWEGYQRIVERYLNPYLGRILLTKLGPEHVQVFISTKSRPLDPDDITHRFKAFVKAAGLRSDFHFRSLRHSRATPLMAKAFQCMW